MRHKQQRANYRLRGQSKWNHKADYGASLLLGLFLSLSILSLLFSIKLESKTELSFRLDEQELIRMEEILPTVHPPEAPPPPPRPSILIEVPDDEVLEDDALNLDAFLDLDMPVDIPPPPVEEEEVYEEPEIFLIVEEYPEIIEIDAIRYPEVARRAGIEGRVVIQMVVDEEGLPTDLRVVDSKHDILNDEALRVARSARFTIPKQRGRAVKVQVSFPVLFRLN